MPVNYFVGIGAQKSGTTWLADYLYDHPDVFLSPYKEMRFFDSKWNLRRAISLSNFRQWWTRRNVDLTKYGEANEIDSVDESRYIHDLYFRSCFRSDDAYRALIDYGASSKLAAGEITPTYSDLSARGFVDMDILLPGCRVILIVRNPADRVASQMKMYKRGGAGESSSLHSFINSHHFVRRGDYKRTLEELFSVMDRDRVLVLFFEHLFDPRTSDACVRRVCHHLGISYRPADISRISDPHRGLEQVRLSAEQRAAIVRRHAPNFEYMREFADGALPAIWEADLQAASHWQAGPLPGRRTS